MNKMPKELKTKLKKLHQLNAQSKELTREISVLFESYGIDQDYFIAMKTDDLCTEALTYIYYGEGLPDDNIQEIESVFLHHVNKK
jgi:hypothetical protein